MHCTKEPTKETTFKKNPKETRVLFETVVRANLSFGQLKGLEGLSQEELFLWLPVKDIIVNDPSSGLILIDIGLAHKQLSLSLFEDPPVCRSQGIVSLYLSYVLVYINYLMLLVCFRMYA